MSCENEDTVKMRSGARMMHVKNYLLFPIIHMYFAHFDFQKTLRLWNVWYNMSPISQHILLNTHPSQNACFVYLLKNQAPLRRFHQNCAHRAKVNDGFLLLL